MRHHRIGAIAASCSLMFAATTAMAEGSDKPDVGAGAEAQQHEAAGQDGAALADEAEARGPQEDLRESAEVLEQMKAEGEMQKLLDRSTGVFIIPDYVTAALLGGVSGGEGVLLARKDGEWSNPAFYDIGSVSFGAQGGLAAGSIAMVFLNDRALESFMENTTFSLTAEAGLSIISWSKWARGEAGRGGDIVVWTDVEGLMGTVAIGIAGVSWDDEENAAFYEEPVTPEKILTGQVDNQYARTLRNQLNGDSSGD